MVRAAPVTANRCHNEGRSTVHDDLAASRETMVERQLIARGIAEPCILNAMRRVPREAFLSPDLRAWAYADAALPIEAGQTITQPFMVARMLQAARLKPEDRVLEIGTGSGYAAAVLAEMVARVDTAERHANEAKTADSVLARPQQRLLQRNKHARANATCGA